MRNIRIALIIITVLSLAVIILDYLTNREAKAPHPDGNFTAMDMSSIYGTMGNFMGLIMPYAVCSLIIAVVGIVLVAFKLKNY